MYPFMNDPWFSEQSDTPHHHEQDDGSQFSARGCPDCLRLQHQLDIGRQRLSAVERDSRDLRQDLRRAVERVEKLEKRLAAMLAAQTRQRGDLPSNAHAEHHVIARDFQTLVEHRLAALARAATPVGLHRPAYRPDHLWFLGQLTQALFQEPPTVEHLKAALHLETAGWNGLATRIERAAAEARTLWQRSERTGLPFRWDFDLLPGAGLDPRRQAPWPSCDPCLPGQYVIAPGYVVEREVYGLQRVLTGPSLQE